MDCAKPLPLVEPKRVWDGTKDLGAAACGGLDWPNSDPKEEPKMLSFVLNPPDLVKRESLKPCGLECDSI
jgi:hypothetical protein